MSGKFIVGEGGILLVTCTDHRVLWDSGQMVYEKYGVWPWGHTPPGGARELIDYPTSIGQHPVLRLHYDRHGARIFVLVVHTNCAGYEDAPWLKIHESEEEYLRYDLIEARRKILRNFPDSRVFAYLGILDVKQGKIVGYEEI